MPKMKKRPPPPSRWPLSTGSAAGRSSKDFFVLAYSADYDKYYAPRNPPTEEYTHVLRFQDLKKSQVCRVPDRLSKVWLSPEGMAYAVGNPEGVFEISPTGCNEVAMDGLPGVFTAIWGTGEDHIFACGIFSTFVLYRRFGAWQQLPLPQGISAGLHGIAGFNERDVYFVGHGGIVLHFDGQSLRNLEVPTTRTLVSISLLDDQYLCIGGYGGSLLFGNQRGWRFVPTGTDEPLLALAQFRQSVCFPTPDGVWSFDGSRAPTLLIDLPAGWINGLGDAITLCDLNSTWLFDGQNLTKLDTVL